jgi:hypothetical protein
LQQAKVCIINTKKKARAYLVFTSFFLNYSRVSTYNIKL